MHDEPLSATAELLSADDPLGVSAAIVNYRAVDYVLSCVASLRADGIDDIVVVDNDSGDACEDRLALADPAVRFVAMDCNRGYGAGANRGVSATKGALVLVCNPDVQVHRGAVSALRAAFAADSTLGVVGPRVEREDGSRYPSARSFPSLVDAAGHAFLGLVSERNRFSRRYLRSDQEAAGPVDWVSGACMAVRRSAFEGVGGFDESFFMFMEDVDLCWRLGRAGWGIAYEPEARVTHIEGVSREAVPYRMIAAHHWSLFRFGLRTTIGVRRAAVPLIAAGLALRAFLLAVRRAVFRRPGTVV